MIRILIDNLDVSTYLLKDGVDDLNNAIEDESGEGTFGSVRIRLSNMNGALTAMARESRLKKAKIYANAMLVFAGAVSPDGFLYDVDREVIEAEIESNEFLFATKAKAKKLTELPYQAARADELIHFMHLNPPVPIENRAIYRKFYEVKALIALIASSCGLTRADIRLRTGPAGADIFKIGGVPRESTATPLPDISCYDFLKAIAQLCNAVWWVDVDDKLWMIDKREFFRVFRGGQQINKSLLRNTLKVQYKKVGWDQIDLAYENATTDIDGHYRGSKKRTDIVIDKRRDITLPFKCPAEHTNNNQESLAFIPLNDVSNNYLVKVLGSEFRVYPRQFITASEALDYFHVPDLYGGAEFSASYSVMDDPSILQFFSQPYRWIFSDQAQMPFFTRKMTLDLREEQFSAEAIGNEYY